MAGIRGITVILKEKEKVGEDPFGAPIYEFRDVEVEDVLVQPASAEDVINSTQLYGKHVVYNLGIPKGDTHDWEDATVEFFKNTFKTFGKVEEGIEEMVPTKWHKKVKCELYE